MRKYIVVVSFIEDPHGKILYMAHIFLVEPNVPQSIQTVQASIVSSSPEQALVEGEFLAWLLNL